MLECETHEEQAIENANGIAAGEAGVWVYIQPVDGEVEVSGQASAKVWAPVQADNCSAHCYCNL